MSFPPRFGMPQMSAGPFVTVPYGLPMVPVVQATHYIVHPTIPSGIITTAGPRMMKRKEPPVYHEKPPVTTVFVGNIHERASNELMKALLQKCGNVLQWKRVHGSNNKFQAFGFCEFDHPDSTLRAIRLLNDLSLVDKKLVVKCDEKTFELIKDFTNKRRHMHGRPPVQATNAQELANEESTRHDDLLHKRAMLQIVHELGDVELAEYSQFVTSDIKFEPTAKSKANAEQETVDKDRKEYLAREIHQFRSTYKDDNKSRPIGRVTRQSRSKSPPQASAAASRDTPTSTSAVSREKTRSPSGQRAASRSSVSRDDGSASHETTRQHRLSSISPGPGTALDSVGGGGDSAAAGAGVAGQLMHLGASPISSRASSLTRSRASAERSAAAAADLATQPAKSSSNRPDVVDKGRDREMTTSANHRDKDRHSRHHRKHGSSNRKRDSSRESVKSPSRMKRRSRSRSRHRNSEDDEELQERKRIERKIREKEYAYQERLQKWESRERKRLREYEKYRQTQRQKRKEESREAKKLKEFFEDYDDEAEDPKYYRGKSYDMRRRDYERERDSDNKDWQKEKEELEEIRQKLLCEGVVNPDEEIRRMQKEQEEKLLKRLRAGSSPSTSPGPGGGRTPPEKDAAAAVSRSNSEERSSRNGRKSRTAERPEPAPEQLEQSKQFEDGSAVVADESALPSSLATASGGKQWRSLDADQSQSLTPKGMGFAGLKISTPTMAGGGGSSAIGGGGHRLQQAATPVAGVIDNRDDNEQAPKKPLVPLEYSEEENSVLLVDPAAQYQNMTVEEKRKAIKSLIEKIPTNKDELFAYSISWPLVDANLIDKRLKPWVNKKIVEYIGEEEPSLVEFICQKVSDKCAPQSILEDVSMVLDDEASVFVVKLWRLLIYEIEAKRFGLVKADA